MIITERERKNHLINEVNSPKSRLLDLQRTLENTPGCRTAADQLGTIIGKLEAWQRRHKQQR
jgi:hypothetical protein